MFRKLKPVPHFILTQFANFVNLMRKSKLLNVLLFSKTENIEVALGSLVTGVSGPISHCHEECSRMIVLCHFYSDEKTPHFTLDKPFQKIMKVFSEITTYNHTHFMNHIQLTGKLPDINLISKSNWHNLNSNSYSYQIILSAHKCIW